jgi:iron complex outermembrane receptor protein
MFDQLMLRGTYSTGFRAPSLAESGNGGVFAQLGGYRDEVRCDETNAIANLLLTSQRGGDVDLGKAMLNSDCSRTVARMTQPNQELKPEKAKITTLGFVYEPTQWLSVSADYWFIYRSNEIVAPDFTRDEDIISSTRSPITDSDRANLAALSAMCADPASGVTCPGTLPGYSVGNVASVVGQYKNRGKTLIDGFDIDARSRFTLGDWGNLNIGLAATIANRNRSYLDDESGWYYGDLVGYYNNPRLRATLNADWTYKQVTTSFFVNYVGGTKWALQQIDEEDNNPQTCTAGYLQLEQSKCDGAPSWWTANLSVGWRPDDHWSLGVTVKNLFNRLPFYDPNSFLGDSSDYASIFGRSYSLQVGYKF